MWASKPEDIFLYHVPGVSNLNVIRQVDPSDRTNETECHKFASVLQSFAVSICFFLS